MNQDHVFIDLETSSLSPESGEILDVAAIRCDRKGNVLATYADRVLPERSVEPEAANKNGYSEEAWRTAVSLHTALAGLRATIQHSRFEEKFVVVAHFADFDRAFLEAACKTAHVPQVLAGRAWICTGQLAWPLVASGLLSSRSLDSVSKYHGVVNTAPHTAMGDVVCLKDTYFEMMRRYKLALAGEDMLRTVGGPRLEAAKKWFGL
jgi:DNA polymerase III epsilon subunit-like protein